MARTVVEIYNAMIAEKEALLVDNSPKYPTLEVLTSTSKTAIWRLMLYIMSFGVWALEMLFDRHKVNVELVRAGSILHTGPWLVSESKLWQYGDVPIIINNNFAYEELDVEKMIIKYAAVSDIPGRVFLKVAKDNNGALEPLSINEFDSFSAYMNKYKAFPGQSISVISQIADDIKLNVTVYYNTAVVFSELEDDVLEAINNYLEGLPFDGIFKSSSLVDVIQSVTGVLDVVLSEAQAKAFGESYVLINRIYNAVAGYLSLDTANSIISYVED